MKLFSTFLFALATLALTMPASLFAHGGHQHDIREHLEAGLHIGLPLFGDVEDNNLAYGAQLDYHWNPEFSTELAFTRFDDSYKSGRLSDLGVPNASADLTANNFSLSGKWNVWGDNERVNGFVGGGIDYFNFSPDVGGLDNTIDGLGIALADVDVDIDDTWGWHLMAGLDYAVGVHWELFTDLRYTVADTDATLSVATTTADGITPPGVRASQGFDFDHAMLRVGVNWRW